MKVLYKTINKIIKQDFPGMASEMAFNFMFALIPFFIFLISIFGLLGSNESINTIVQSLKIFVPFDIIKIIRKTLEEIIESSSIELLTFGFIVSLWSASRATNIIIKSINKVYDITESRSIWKTRLLAIIIVLVIAVILMISVNLIIFGKLILNLVENFTYISSNTEYLLLMIRWPITFLALFITSLFVYFITPDIKNNFKLKLLSSIPGAIFFCIFWLLGSWLFSLYIENFGKYNETFGLLGGIMLLLSWLYYSSLILLTGGAINAHYFKELNSKNNF